MSDSRDYLTAVDKPNICFGIRPPMLTLTSDKSHAEKRFRSNARHQCMRRLSKQSGCFILTARTEAEKILKVYRYSDGHFVVESNNPQSSAESSARSDINGKFIQAHWWRPSKQ